MRSWGFPPLGLQQGEDGSVDPRDQVIQTRPGAVPQLKHYLDEMPGMPVQNLWDICLSSTTFEGMARYQTKSLWHYWKGSLRLNKSVICARSFCGCGTAIEARLRLEAMGWNRHNGLALDVVERR